MVVFNGTVTDGGQDPKLASGPIALRYGSVVKFRKAEIRPL